MAVVANQSLTVLSTDPSNNTAVLRYVVTCTTSGESHNNYTQIGTFAIDGIEYTESYTLPSNSTTTVFSKDVTVGDASERVIEASFSFPTTPAGGVKSGSTSVTIPKIKLYANITSYSITEVGLNSLKVNWLTDVTCDAVQYSLNDASWIDTSGISFIISNLSPNTNYSVKIRVKRIDSQLWTTSEHLYATTNKIGKIVSANNFKHGDSAIINITNPSGSELSLEMKINNNLIFSKKVSAGKNTISFNDTQLDNIYKLYGSSNSLTATFILTTANSYTNSKTCTITFFGNQKTIHKKVNGAWRRGKVYIKVNGTWRRGAVWKKVNGTWRRCI